MPTPEELAAEWRASGGRRDTTDPRLRAHIAPTADKGMLAEAVEQASRMLRPPMVTPEERDAALRASGEALPEQPATPPLAPPATSWRMATATWSTTIRSTKFDRFCSALVVPMPRDPWDATTTWRAS
jgi:hypothetical protein